MQQTNTLLQNELNKSEMLTVLLTFYAQVYRSLCAFYHSFGWLMHKTA